MNGSIQLRKDIIRYIILMIIGLIVSARFFDGDSAVFWAINLVGLFVFFAKYIRFISKNTLMFSVLYIVCFSILPIIGNFEYLSASIKTIGTSVGLITFPFYIALFKNFQKNEHLFDEDIIAIYTCISIIGTILLLFSIVLAFNDYIRIIHGSFSAYDLKVAGLLKNKNTYGALLAISACCDMFLLRYENNRSKWFLLFFKSIGIILSFSRAALLYFCINTIVFFWTERKHFHIAWVMGILTIAILLWIILDNISFQNEILKQVLRIGLGDTGRTSMKNSALAIFANNIYSTIFGIGYFGIDYLNIDIDSSYYHVLFSGGILKCIIYLFVSCFSLKRIILLKSKSKYMYHICLSVFLSYFVYAAFESIPLFELGLLTFENMFFMFIIPNTYISNDQNSAFLE